MKAVGKKKYWMRVLLFGLLLCTMMGASAQAGWKTSNGKRYYVNSSGKRVKNKWFKVGKYYYYADKNGVVQKEKWIGDCYVKSNYRRASGLLKIKKKTYYFNPYDGRKATGWQTIKNNRYYFKSNGVMVAGGWKTIDGERYYFKSSGAAVTGWQTIGGSRYYFGSDGKMAKNTTLTMDGTTYTFDANGNSSDESMGEKIVSYAKKFLGNPYVYGGNNLKTGVDCSGFTQQVLAYFGIYIRRTADEQRVGGKGSYTITNYGNVKLTNGTKITKTSLMKPGDLIFYGTKKPAYAGHVAIYIGGGKIIHAATEDTGIIVSKYNYQPPIAVRRYW